MSTVPVQVVVTSTPQVAVEVAGAAPVMVATGVQGPPGPPGETLLAGYVFTPSSLSMGDHIEYVGLKWANVHKSTISDGGNF